MNTLARPIASPRNAHAPGETFGCTRKQIRFARLVMEDVPPAKAYVDAGYKASSTAVAAANARKVMARPNVTQLIQHMQAIANSYTTVTVASLTAELEEARQLAIECEQPSAVTGAIMAKAKLHGLDINRTQVEQRVSVQFDGAAEKLFHALSARHVIEGVGEKLVETEKLPTHPPDADQN